MLAPLDLDPHQVNLVQAALAEEGRYRPKPEDQMVRWKLRRLAEGWPTEFYREELSRIAFAVVAFAFRRGLRVESLPESWQPVWDEVSRHLIEAEVCANPRLLEPEAGIPRAVGEAVRRYHRSRRIGRDHFTAMRHAEDALHRALVAHIGVRAARKWGGLAHTRLGDAVIAEVRARRPPVPEPPERRRPMIMPALRPLPAVPALLPGAVLANPLTWGEAREHAVAANPRTVLGWVQAREAACERLDEALVELVTDYHAYAYLRWPSETGPVVAEVRRALQSRDCLKMVDAAGLVMGLYGREELAFPKEFDDSVRRLVDALEAFEKVKNPKRDEEYYEKLWDRLGDSATHRALLDVDVEPDKADAMKGMGWKALPSHVRDKLRHVLPGFDPKVGITVNRIWDLEVGERVSHAGVAVTKVEEDARIVFRFSKGEKRFDLLEGDIEEYTDADIAGPFIDFDNYWYELVGQHTEENPGNPLMPLVTRREWEDADVETRGDILRSEFIDAEWAAVGWDELPEDVRETLSKPARRVSRARYEETYWRDEEEENSAGNPRDSGLRLYEVAWYPRGWRGITRDIWEKAEEDWVLRIERLAPDDFIISIRGLREPVEAALDAGSATTLDGAKGRADLALEAQLETENPARLDYAAAWDRRMSEDDRWDVLEQVEGISGTEMMRHHLGRWEGIPERLRRRLRPLIAERVGENPPAQSRAETLREARRERSRLEMYDINRKIRPGDRSAIEREVREVFRRKGLLPDPERNYVFIPMGADFWEIERGRWKYRASFELLQSTGSIEFVLGRPVGDKTLAYGDVYASGTMVSPQKVNLEEITVDITSREVET